MLQLTGIPVDVAAVSEQRRTRRSEVARGRRTRELQHAVVDGIAQQPPGIGAVALRHRPDPVPWRGMRSDRAGEVSGREVEHRTGRHGGIVRCHHRLRRAGAAHVRDDPADPRSSRGRPSTSTTRSCTRTRRRSSGRRRASRSCRRPARPAGITSPSTDTCMSPSASTSRPVAATTTSASISSPDARRMPCSVNVSITPVTTSARPDEMARNRSPPGTTHMRWSHGAYAGVKCVATS